MDNKNSDEIIQVAFCRAVLSLLVRRGLVSNDEADRAMRIITQEIDNTEAENVA